MIQCLLVSTFGTAVLSSRYSANATFVHLWIWLHDAAAAELKDLPVDLDPVRFEDLARVFRDGLEAASREREDRGPRAGKADPKQTGVRVGRDVARNFREARDLCAAVRGARFVDLRDAQGRTRVFRYGWWTRSFIAS